MSVAKRRRKAVLRRQWVTDLRDRWDQARAVAQALCPCGFRAWLGAGATAEDRADYEQVVEDHFGYCGVSA